MKRSPKLTLDQRKELEAYIKITDDPKEIRRSQAVLLTDKDTDYSIISSLTGFKERAALNFRKRYLEKGIAGLENKRKSKSKTLLRTTQRIEIIEFLRKTTPRDHDYESDFWGITILGDLIKRKYGVVYKSRKPLYLLFEGAKFSYHIPGQVYEKRDESKVLAWREEIKAPLTEAIENPNPVILCEDEIVLSSKTTLQKVWLKKGDFPEIDVANTKRNKSIYGFLNIKTGKEHAFIKDGQNILITVEVLRELREIYPTQNILLFWDGAGWHRGSKVMKFIEEDKNIKVVYFPPYSPEENPQEHVWKAGRSAVTHNKFIQDLEKITKDFVDYLHSSNFNYKFFNCTAQS